MFKSSVIQNVHSISWEFSTKKEVNEIDLADTIDEIDNFQTKESCRIHGMSTPMHSEVLDNFIDLAFFFACI